MCLCFKHICVANIPPLLHGKCLVTSLSLLFLISESSNRNFGHNCILRQNSVVLNDFDYLKFNADGLKGITVSTVQYTFD